MRLLELECRCLLAEAEEAARIAAERIAEITGGGAPDRLRITFDSVRTDGFVLEITENRDVFIGAARTRDYVAGLGELLNRLLAAADRAGALGAEADPTAGGAAIKVELAPGRWEIAPELTDRIHYMPGHFGNSFEVCWSGEMQRYLEDLALAGASGYGDWFDPNDMPDPYHSHVYHSSSMFLWRRKKEWLRMSQRLGLDNILVITPNVGYVDQMRPDWVGVRDHKLRVQGQVLCPSNPAAREVILNNHRQLFDDLKESGIRIEKIVCVPYDDGGCACPSCQPYYPVFLELVRDVYGTVSAFYPELKADICGWWTSDEELLQLQQFIAGPAKDWFGVYQFSATYGVFELPDVRERIGDMRLGCFLHIGFSHDRRDVYTKTGVHSASRRISSVLGSFARQQCTGFMSYNESFGDHFNAFAASRLGWNPAGGVRDIAEYYGRLLFRLRGDTLNRFVDVLLEMEMLEESKAAGWQRELEAIERYASVDENRSWSFAQIRLKAELMALDYTIASQMDSGGIEAAYPLMKRRVQRTERLWRSVYGFGVLRHILIPDNMMPQWYKAYTNYANTGAAGSIRSGVMSSEA
ncbi:hypothetical protein [Paenibacillus oceani]|uniref:Uncharacterized protein n=1 Tax=Paenibacillus oceani TaxID=2772510 RepID=A0A927CHH1_9BACL|nr:hypothetical protein [Paenibacillus oceani]MBD2866692.1 hypothetical protein [Paenibacillus oceani]